MSNPVRYGDIVYIQFDFNKQDIVLSGEGFFRSNLWAGPKKILASASFRSCLFQIYPIFIDSQETYIDMYDRKLKNYSEVYSKNPEFVEKFESELNSQKMQIKNSAPSVKLFNQKEINETKGYPLTYNSRFFLKHIDSGLFLEMLSHTEPLSSSLLTARLTREPILMHYFVFRPVNASNVISDYTDIATYSETFYIYSPYHKLALTYSPAAFQREPLKILESEYLNGYQGQFPLTLAHRQPAENANQAVYLVGALEMSENSKVTLVRFNIEIPDAKVEEVQNLRVGDYFRFNAHGRYLSVRYFGGETPQDKLNQFRFEETTDATALTVSLALSIFQVIQVSDIDKAELPSQNEIPSFETEEKKRLYKVENPRFLLKHLISGKIFAIRKSQSGEPEPMLLQIEEIKTDIAYHGYVEFVRHDDLEEEFVKLKSYYLIRFKNYLDSELYLDIGSKVTEEEPNLKSKFFTGLMNPEKKFDEKKLHASEWHLKFVQNSQETGYATRCELLPEDEVHQILETQNLIFRFIEFFNFLEEYKVSSGRAPLSGDKSPVKSTVSRDMKRLSFRNVDSIADIATDSFKRLAAKISNMQACLEDFLTRIHAFVKSPANFVFDSKRTLRELKVLGAAATLLLVLVIDEKLVGRIKNKISDFKIPKEIFDPSQYVSLLRTLNKFLRNSVHQSDSNKMFLSQYINVFANFFLIDTGAAYELIDDQAAVFNLKAEICDTAKNLLSEVNFEALEQFQNNTDMLIKLLLQEKDYGGLILGLIRHLLSFSADVNSLLRERLTKVLAVVSNIRHIFPTFFIENDEIKIRFERSSDKTLSRIILATELTNPKNLNGELLELYNYLDLALETAIALAAFVNTQIIITLIKHFPIKAILKLIQGEVSCSRGIKNKLLEIAYKIHFKYFQLPIESLPSTIRINVMNAEIKEQLDILEQFIDQSTERAISEYEWDYIRKNNYSQEILEAQEEYKKRRTNGLAIQGGQGGKNNLEEIIQVLSEFLLTQAQGDLSKEAVFKMFKMYQKALELAYDQQRASPSTSNYAVTRTLELFESVQDKRVKYTTDVILAGIEKNLTPVIDSDENKQAPPSRESEKENLLKDEKNDASEQVSFNPLAIVSKILNQEDETEELIGENPRWVKMTKENEILKQIEKLRLEIGADDTISLFIRIISLKDFALSSLAIKNLRIAASFEQSLFSALLKTEFVTDINEMKKTAEIFRAGTDIYKIARTFRNTHLYVPNEFTSSGEFDHILSSKNLDKLLKELNTKIDFLIVTIYNTAAHFKGSFDTNSEERFISALTISKTHEDLPFRINHNGIRNKYQEIFYVLKIHEIIIGLVEMLYKQMDRFGSFSKSLLIVVRKCYVFLSLFCANENLNKNALFDNQVLKQIFAQYGDRFISESIDGLIMVNEILAGNERLSKFDNLPLMKLLIDTFVTPLSVAADIPFESMTWKEYICTNSLRFLVQVELPSTLAYFDIGEILKNYFTSLGHFFAVGSLKELSLTKLMESQQNTIIKLSPTYYSIKELLECWIWIIPTLEKSNHNIDLLFTSFSLANWIQILLRPELLFQFEIRKLLCQTFYKVYELATQKRKFVEEVRELRDLVFILLDDMRAFVEYSSVQYQKEPVRALQSQSKPIFDLQQLGRFGFDPKLNAVREVWELFYSKRLDKLSLNIYLEAIPIKELWNDYIYNGCCKLLELLMMRETDLMTKILTDKSNPPTIFQHYTHFLEKLLECPEKSFDKSAYTRMDSNFDVLLGKRDYTPYKQQLERYKQLLKGQRKLVEQLKLSISIQDYSQVSDSKKAITSLIEYSDLIYDVNVERISKCVQAAADKKKDVLEVLLDSLSDRFASLDNKDITLILKILRVPIEQEKRKIEQETLSNSSQAVSRKQILQQQGLLQELGLTDTIIVTTIKNHDEEVLREILSLSLAYLYGGNKDIQTEFYNAFVKDSENMMLLKLSNLLEKKFDVFIERETSRIQELYQTSLELRFEYLEEQEQEVKDERALQLMFSYIQSQFRKELKFRADDDPQNELLLVILRFLQALSENQFTLLQNFLREQKQPDEDDESKTFKNSFNFLDLLTTFFNYYHRVHSAYNSEIGKQIISVIIEMIQGDVDLNIQTVIEKSLYLDVTRVLTDYNSTLHLLPRGYSPEPYRKRNDLMLIKEKKEAQAKKAKKYAKLIEDNSSELENSLFFMDLKSKCLELLITIAQYPSEKCVESLQNYVDKARLLEEFEKIMNEVFEWHNAQVISEEEARSQINARLGTLRNEEFGGVLGDAVSIYILFRYLWENEWESNLRDIINNSSRSDFQKKVLEIWLFQFMRYLAASVEIVVERKDQDLIRYWFPVIPQTRYFRRDLKEKLLNDIDRTSPETKIDSVMDNIDEVRAEMKDEYDIRVLKKNISTRGLFLFILSLSFCIAVTVNYINLISVQEGQTVLNYWQVLYDMIFHSNLPDNYTGSKLVKMLIALICVYLNFFLAITNIILWLSTQWPRQQRMAWKDRVDAYRNKVGGFPLSIQKKLDTGQYESLDKTEAKIILMYKGPESEEFKKLRKYPAQYKKIRALYWRNSVGAVLIKFEFIWLLIYAFISFMAIAASTKFSMFLLADVAVRSDALKRLLQAVLKNLRQFLWTLFLLIFIALVYTYIAFYIYGYRMLMNSRDLCSDYFECFLNVLDLGARSGGGISDNLVPVAYASNAKTAFVLGVIFDLSFYFIVVAVLLNLIFGMIVDAFGNLRDDKFEADKDQLNVCLICSLERQDLRGVSFDEQHRGQDHNLWNYINFIIYVKDKEENNRTEMNGIENYVARKIASKENDWVPQRRSLSLEKIEAEHKKKKEDDEEQVTKQVDSTLEEIKAFKKNMTHLVVELQKSIVQAKVQKIDEPKSSGV